jgi:uncharacterized membrane protein
MIAHAIINIPMTPVWQGALLVVFAVGAFFAWRGGMAVAKQVFRNAGAAACIFLALALTAYEIAGRRFGAMTYVAMGMLGLAVALESLDRRESRGAEVASASA